MDKVRATSKKIMRLSAAWNVPTDEGDTMTYVMVTPQIGTASDAWSAQDAMTFVTDVDTVALEQ